MISTDFAPNETIGDSIYALKNLFSPELFKLNNLRIPEIEEREVLKSFFPHHDTLLFLYARTALLNLFQALKLAPNSEVLVTGFTCDAVLLPVYKLNLKPIFVDIDTTTYSMNVRDLIKKVTSRSKVIILQHTFGIVPHRKEILAFAQKHNLLVIEDLAHGFDPAEFLHDEHRTIKLLSFGRSKALSTVMGGALAIPDAKLYELCRKVQHEYPYPTYMQVLRIHLYKLLTPFIKATYPILIGKVLHWILNTTRLFTNELSEKERAGEYDMRTAKQMPYSVYRLLKRQLTRYPKVVQKRFQSVKSYNESLQPDSNEKIIWGVARYPYLVADEAQLTQIIQNAKQKGIYLGKWYKKILPPQGSCPVTEDVSRRIINLPTLVSPSKVKRVIELFV